MSLRTSAVNITLPAAAARAPAAIDTRVRQVADVDRRDRQTDGWTDGRTPDRYKDPALHTVRAASIIAVGFLKVFFLLFSFIVCTSTPRLTYIHAYFISATQSTHIKLEGKYSLESTDPRESEICAHLRP